MQNNTQDKKQPGRPLTHGFQDDPMNNYTARLTAWHARLARRLGDGNLSAGLRLAVESFAGRKDMPAAPVLNSDPPAV